MANIYNPKFNQNVVEVYTEEPGYTGFKGLDFTKIDSIESILESGTNVSLSGSNVFLSRISSDASGLNNKVFATGDVAPGGVQGTIVFQADLTAQYDNVDVAGYAGADISGIRQNLSDGIKTYPYSSSTISNYATSGVNGLVLSQDNNRKELFVQNLDTGVLYVKYGLNASSGSFNFVLAPNSLRNAGDGGSLSDKSYAGDVSVSGLFTPRYISWQRT